MKASKIKNKLKRFFQKIDQSKFQVLNFVFTIKNYQIGKQGEIDQEVFFSVLSLHGITIPQNEMNRICLKAKGQTQGGSQGKPVKYREALLMINPQTALSVPGDAMADQDQFNDDNTSAMKMNIPKPKHNRLNSMNINVIDDQEEMQNHPTAESMAASKQ